MIIDGKLLKRIKKIRENYKGEYKYILLGFFNHDKVEIFFSNQDVKRIKYFSNIVPLLIIYDRDRYEHNKSDNIDEIMLKVLNRSIETEKVNLTKSYLKNISYTDFTSNKESIIKTIDASMKTIKIIDIFFKTLNEEYLKANDLKILQSLENKLLEIVEDEYLYSIKEIELLYKKTEFQINNINHIIRTNKCVFLHSFFFKDRDTLLHLNNDYSSKDIQSMIEIFLQQQRRYTDTYYNQILNEIEYCNLYIYDYPLYEDRYKKLHFKLFSNHNKNRITALKKSFLEYDIFLNMALGLDVGFMDYIYQWFYDKYNISFQGYKLDDLLSNKEIDDNDIGLMNLLFNQSSATEEVYNLISNKHDKYIENEISKFNEDYLYKYIENLQIGQIKHRKI